MYSSNYVVREVVTDYTISNANEQQGTSSFEHPNLTWEQFVLIHAELDRLILLNKDLVRENESLKAQLGQQHSLLSERESLRLEISNLRGSNIRLSEQETRISSLTLDNQRLSSQLSEKLAEVEMWRNKYNNSEKDSVLIRELKSKLVTLGSESEKLGDLLREKVRENEELKQRSGSAAEAERKLKFVTQERDKFSALVNEAQSNKVKIEQLELFIVELNDFKQKYVLLQAENERLHNAIGTMQREIEVYRQKLGQFGELEARFKALLQERDHLIGLLNEKTRESDSLRQRILELERGTAANRDLHGKLALLAAENERLNNVLTEISNELDGFRKKFNELGDLETRLAMLLIEKERLTQERERLLRELEALRLKAQEADRLNVVVIERSRENDELRTKNAAIPHLEVRVNQSEQDREALKRALADKDRIIGELRLRISQLENESLVINDLKGKLVLLAAENERLHQDKERELSILRAENQRLNLLLLEKIKIIEEWENKYHVLEELYLNVRETTEHLNIVKQKYDNAVNLTEQSEPRLRLSIDAKQRKSISSEVRPVQSTYESTRVHTIY